MLEKKSSHMTQEDRDRVAMLKAVRERLIVAQGHITLTTDGETYQVTLPAEKRDVDE